MKLVWKLWYFKNISSIHAFRSQNLGFNLFFKEIAISTHVFCVVIAMVTWRERDVTFDYTIFALEWFVYRSLIILKTEEDDGSHSMSSLATQPKPIISKMWSSFYFTWNKSLFHAYFLYLIVYPMPAIWHFKWCDIRFTFKLVICMHKGANGCIKYAYTYSIHVDAYWKLAYAASFEIV